MLTLRKITVATGDVQSVGAVTGYLLEKADAPGNFFQDTAGRANSMWLGSDAALAALGVERGSEVLEADLARALQGQNAQTGDRIRREGKVWATAKDDKGLAVRDKQGVLVKERVDGCVSLEFTAGVPKSWSAALARTEDPDERQRLLHSLVMSTYGSVEHIMQTRNVVRHGGRLETARGIVGAFAVHMTARRAEGEELPSPHVHVHAVIVGLERTDGKIVSPGSWTKALYEDSAMLEAGAVFRADLADDAAELGYEIRRGTGRNARFFELAGVPQGLIEAWSGRTEEVKRRVEELEHEWAMKLKGRALSLVALETRQDKDKGIEGERAARTWRVLADSFGFTKAAMTAMRRPGRRPSLEERRQEAAQEILARFRQRGPTMDRGQARALVYEASAGLLRRDDARDLMEEMERSGALVVLEENQVTSRQIRAAERRVLSTAESAAHRGDSALSAEAVARGIAVASAKLGEGKALDPEQEDAVRLLTSGAAWTILTGRAGTGKGPTLDAVVKAYEADGWQVIACGADNKTAKLLGDQTGAQARSLESLRRRVKSGSITLNSNTLILIDEATKVDLRYWHDLARWTEHFGIRVAAIGHDGQLGAIELPGMFSELLRVVPVAELHEIRRHQEQWLRDYQVALDEGKADKAVDILVENDAISWYDTREQAMEGMVAEWDENRREYSVTDAIMVVQGPNTDVEQLNVLAQACRQASGDLGVEGVQAPDRDYSIYRGDVVVVRGMAYTFEDKRGRPGDRRVENGQVGVVERVNSARGTISVRVKEPGHAERVVEFDLRRLRERGLAGEEVPGVDLGYAWHAYNVQGDTKEATSHLGGHWSQAKEGTYVSDTRAKIRHRVHLAREDLGALLTDAQRLKRYAQILAKSAARAASVAFETDEATRLTTDSVFHEPVPDFPVISEQEAGRRHVREADGVLEPLEPYRELLGDEAMNRLVARANVLQSALGERSEGWLRVQRDRYAVAMHKLDPRVAREAAVLRRDQLLARERVREATGEASRLRAQAAKLKRLSEREARRDLLEAAHVQHRLAEQARAERYRLSVVARDLLENPRHPNRWLEAHGESAARWAALQGALASREDAHIDLDRAAVAEVRAIERADPAPADREGPDLAA